MNLVIGVEKRRKIVKVVLDIETDQLNASVVNCIVAKNIDTNLVTVFDPDNMYVFKNWSKNIEQYIMHIRYAYYTCACVRTYVQHMQRVHTQIHTYVCTRMHAYIHPYGGLVRKHIRMGFETLSFALCELITASKRGFVLQYDEIE